MPTITVYINKDLYQKLQKVGGSESKTIQDALQQLFEKFWIFM